MSNLTFNILTFEHPETEKEFQFVTENQEGFFPLRNYKLPANAVEILSVEDFEKEVPLYTNFIDDTKGDLKLSVSFRDSPEFALHYYRTRIFDFFKQKDLIVRFNFINDIEIWLEAKDVSLAQCTYYHKIGLRVQIGRVSDKPELLVYYVGKTRVLNKNVQELSGISSSNYKKVIYKNRLIKYKYLSDEARDALDEVYPLINPDLERALEIESGFQKVDNRYTHIYKYINGFYLKYLNTEEFKKIIPISEDGFLKVPHSFIGVTSEASNLLKFGNSTGVVPKKDIWKKKPLQNQPHNNLHFIFIRHKDADEAYQKTLSYFHGNDDFYGIQSFVKVPFHNDKVNGIVFSDLDNPMPEIEEKLRPFHPKPNVKYLAIYISPFTKEEKSTDRKNLYYQLKHLLLEHDISSQAIEEETVLQSDFKWSMTNIGIAILAKLDGIPWKLDTPFKRELVFGVGAFENREKGVRYVGNTFCFSNDGVFKEFSCYSQDELFLLAGDIEISIKDFQKKHKNFRLERLVIHFYKTMSDRDLKPIYKVLEKLHLPIPVFVVSINKTESEDYLVFDESYNEKMPYSGTIVNIGRNEYLLCNNTRYRKEDKISVDGFHLPIKLKLSCSKPQLLTEEAAQELIDQVYQFSRIYWKALKQQNLPVTIKYPEMVAKIAPHFKNGVIPQYGRQNLWFL